MDDAELYARGAATLVASWEAYARGAAGASLLRLPGVAAGVFPRGPERAVYNNALLERGLGDAAGGVALDALEEAYAAAGVARYAAWVHESDAPLRAAIEERGYALDATTRAMGMALTDIRVARPAVEQAPPAWAAYLRFLAADGVPEGLLAGADPSEFHVVLARSAREHVAAGLAFDHDGDCGIYNVGTVEHARRRGLGTAVTALLAHDAAARGCRTASIQSTPMAERVYAAVGFRDLGRFLEYVPADR
jgi:ribosomal protein S18 acetylase RimI-like enzyme